MMTYYEAAQVGTRSCQRGALVHAVFIDGWIVCCYAVVLPRYESCRVVPEQAVTQRARLSPVPV